MKLRGDQPIPNKSLDLLSRTKFAEHIAQGLLDCGVEEGLCVAIQGPWGCGKTSVINLCLEAIKEKTATLPESNRPIIMRFQPWLISGREQLINAFLTQLQHTLGQPNLSENARNAARYLERYAKLVTLVTWVPKIGGPARRLKGWLEKLRGTAESVAEIAERDLEGIKGAVCANLRKLETPLLVVVDEVDRLTYEEIRQLFQLIKAVADFPRTIYILAFDPALVQEALKPLQGAEDTRYLEKIVQLPFEVPVPSQSSLTAILIDGLEEFIKDIPDDEKGRWNELRFGPLPQLFRNMRDVKRYLNSLAFVYPLIREEVSVVDLLIIEALHVFAPTLYKLIRNNREFLLSDSPRSSMMRHREDKEKNEWIEALPKYAPEYCRDACKEMLSLVFPEIESVYKKHGWGSGFVERWTRNRRVCIKSRFDWYFQGSLPEGEISASEARFAIEATSDSDRLTQVLKSYFQDRRIGKILWHLENYIEENLDSALVTNLTCAVFTAGDDMPLRPTGMLELPEEWQIEHPIYRLLKKFSDKSERAKILFRALERSQESLRFPVSFANWIWREWRPKDAARKQTPEEERLLSKEDAEKLKDAILGRIVKAAESKKLLKYPYLLSILYDWSRWSSEDEVKGWVSKVLSDDRNIPEFLVGCGGFVSSGGMESHYSITKFRIDSESLRKFCDVDALRVRCQEMLAAPPEWMDENQQKVLEIFIKSFEKKQPWDDDHS